MNDPHPTSEAIGYRTAHELAADLEQRRVTSRHLVDVLLERMTSIDAAHSPTHLNAIAAVSADARDVAEQRDEDRRIGRSRGPLHGIPILIKDNIEACGLPGTAGSTALVGRPSRDAPLVTRLRDAGAIILASTNLSQWANMRSLRSTSGYSATGGLVGNPWSLDRSAGGSSSGSGAALAAGLSPLAIGTETDGSIVCPASVNGVVGLKPTVGTISTDCVVPISASQDSPGPMARTVSDVSLLYGVLSSSEMTAPTTPTIAVAMNWRTGNPDTDALFTDVMRSLRDAGLELVERELALPNNQVYEDELAVLLAEMHDDLSAYLRGRPGEGVTSLADVIGFEDEHRDVEQRFFGHEYFTAAMAIDGRAGPAYGPARARNLQWAVDTCLCPGLEGVDVLIAPAYGPSWKSDLAVGGHPGPASVATMAPAIAGWPILCLPMGLVQELPVGLAVIGRARAEWTILHAAQRIEVVIAERGPLARPSWRNPSRG